MSNSPSTALWWRWLSMKKTWKTKRNGNKPFSRKLCRLQQVIQPNYASGHQKLGQQSIRVLLSLLLGERTYDHRNDNAGVLPALAVAVVAVHIAVDSSRMDRSTQQAWSFEAIDLELMDEIE